MEFWYSIFGSVFLFFVVVVYVRFFSSILEVKRNR